MKPARLSRRRAARRHRRPLVEQLESRQLLAPLTPGNLLVLRVGDGSALPVGNVAVSVFLDEVTPSGELVQSIAVPATDNGANHALTASALEGGEGLLSRSDDGRYVFFAGYDAPLGTPSLTNTLAPAVPRVIARVDASGAIDTTTAITDGYSGATIRNAHSPDGTNLWISGSTGGSPSGGIRHTTFGSSGPTTQISTAFTNIRGLTVADGQLYAAASAPASFRLGAVGLGAPTTPGQPIVTLAGIPGIGEASTFGNSPNQFFFADLSPLVPGVDTVYIADNLAGLCKFSFSPPAGAWIPNGSLRPGSQGLRSLAGRVEAGTVTLYAASTATENNEVVRYVDSTGHEGNLNQLLSQLGYSSGTRRIARGIAFVPELTAPPLDPAPTIAGTAADDSYLLRRTGENLVLSLGGTTLLDQPLAKTTTLTINALSGNDQLTIDYSGGDPIPVGGVFFHGGSSSAIPGDRLAIVGTHQQTGAYLPAGKAGTAEGHDGSITIDGRPIAFTGLEGLELVDLASATISLPGADDVLTAGGGLTSAGAAALIVGGSSGGAVFAPVALRGNLVIGIETTTVDGADTITLAGGGDQHGNANLSLTTGNGSDLVEIAAAVSFAGWVNLSSQRIDFPLAQSLLGAGGTVTLNAGSGPIRDASPHLPSIAAPSLAATAGTGIVLGTSVATLSAASISSTTGNIEIHNLGGLLTIGEVGGISGIANSNAATAGQVVVTSSGPLTIAANVVSPGSVAVVAGETANDDVDHLVVSGAGIVVRSLESSVTLRSGDDLILGPGTTVWAATSVDMHVDQGNLDSTGETLAIDGVIASSSGATLTGGSQNDTFRLAAQSTTSFQIDGEDPAGSPAGDLLSLDVTGALGSTLVLGGPGAGAWSFANRQSVSYLSIEQVNLTPAAAPDDLILDLKLAGFQDGAADDILVRLDEAGTTLLIDISGVPVFAGAARSVKSLAILGSADDDRLRIQEVAGRLPRFAGQTPGVDHAAMGGGTANPSHLGASADLLLEALFFSGSPWDATDVSIHFDGGAGHDSLDIDFSSGRLMAHTSDELDTAGSGNLLAASALGPDLLLSFADVALLNLAAPSSVVIVDATGTPDTAAITISDDALTGDGWSQVAGDGGLAITRFRGPSQLLVFGGEGGETIDQVGLDSASSLVSSLLAGGNISDFLGRPGGDTSGDTIRVRSTPASTPVTIRGHGGDDLVQLFDAAWSVDQLQAGITINGDGGQNTLLIDDRGDVSGDNVLIDRGSIDGITAATGIDIQYTGIDVLDLTATQGDDTLDASFGPGSDLDAITLSGWTGSDRFLLSTSDEQVGGAATGIQTIGLFGDAPGNPNPGDGSDQFGSSPAEALPGTPLAPGQRPIRPSRGTRIDIDGGRPAVPLVGGQAGDGLNLDLSALAGPLVLATSGSEGQSVLVQTLAAAGHQPLRYAQIEQLGLADRGATTSVAMGDLYVRGSDATDIVQFLATQSPLATSLRLNAFAATLAVPGRVVVDAAGGNDYVLASAVSRPVEIYGGAGDDYLTGTAADDKLVGGPGRDRIYAAGGDNVVWGDDDPVAAGLADTEANRQLLAAAGPGAMAETLFADVLSTDGGRDAVYGGPGADQITTGGGDDWAHGGQGHDTLGGGAGHDRLIGGEGNDNLGGGEGHDVLVGGAGHDVLNAQGGHDVLIGGAGDDTLSGDAGRDLLVGGAASYDGAAVESQTAADASDAALAALLADWLADFAASSLLTSDQAGLDKLRGGLWEADEFWTESAAEILDLEPLLDRRTAG
jgi:Ca2+-binding RTX toxin-like protein